MEIIRRIRLSLLASLTAVIVAGQPAIAQQQSRPDIKSNVVDRTEDVLADLKRLSSGAKAGPPSDMTKPSGRAERGDRVWLKGTPVPADAETVGLRIGERVMVHIRVEDLLQAEGDAGSDLFRLAVSPDTDIAVTTTRVFRAGAGAHSLWSLGYSGVPNPAAARFLAPWFRSQRYWNCAAGEAESCDGRHGPLYDDGGFINGDLIDCYVSGAEACDRMDRSLPP
jgi:hypothetical protein